jgi:uncharacterized membrane protein YdjX (TVP38/TMEM64 family)
LAVIVGLVILFFALGFKDHLGIDALARRYAEIEGWRASHPIGSAALAILLYAGVTAIALPAGALLTVAIGVVFGWALGASIVVIGATIGAIILFLAARTALEPFFRARAGKFLTRFADGFRSDAASYLLFLRLVPLMPFWLLNVIPALLGVKLTTFAWTTLAGIVPGTIAYAYAGEGLRSIVAERAAACEANIAPCGTPFAVGDLVTREILIAMVLLALVALLPVVLKRWRGHKDGAPSN